METLGVHCRLSPRSRLLALTYSSYLKVDELLTLQKPLSDGPEHDETLFIIIHQVYELWFKQMIHEGERLRTVLSENRPFEAGATLTRMLTILKTMVAQIDILETMTPVSFLSFRARLESSSGFQSYQFREFEFLLGKKNAGAIGRYEEGSAARARLERRLGEPTVYDAFLKFLKANGRPVPGGLLSRDVKSSPEANSDLQRVLIDLYHHDPGLRQICELLVDLDEGIQEWRYRHVKMVERTIGFKQGTGGSPGVGYLRTTLFTPLFPDLWEIRTSL